MAYTTINKSSLHMNIKLFTGNQTARSITGVGFQPDLVWIKPRDNGSWSHNLTDVVRGAGYGLFSDLNNAQYNYGTGTDGSVRTFDSDGFSIGTATQVNNNSSNIVAWSWKAGGGQGSSNTDGSINTIYTSVNTTAGFSISRFDGTGANATVGHGLGAVPKMIIVKNLDSAEAWTVYHGANTSEPQTERLYLNATDATSDSASSWNDTAPTSTVFTVGASGETNANGAATIAYCFAEKQGYSKFGSYTGNGSTDGAFVYTGFKPAWFMLKRTDGANSWQIFDNKRDTGNALDNALEANDSAAEATGTDRLDFLSQGVKLRTNGSAQNASGGSYIYMAFAEAPLVGSNNIPCTAR